MTTTPTLDLTQYATSDKINWVNEYNKDMFNIDTAVKANQTSLNATNAQVATKANQTSLDATNAIVAQKADKSEVTNIMTPKGNVAYASLPATGNTVGWYYYCPDGDGTHGAGNYVWNGTAWYFGGTGDEGYSILKENLTDLDTNTVETKQYTNDNMTSATGWYIRTTGLTIGTSANNKVMYFMCEPNTKYRVSVSLTNQYFSTAYTKGVPAVDGNVYGYVASASDKSLTITTGSDAMYLVVCCSKDDNNVIVSSTISTIKRVINTERSLQYKINGEYVATSSKVYQFDIEIGCDYLVKNTSEVSYMAVNTRSTVNGATVETVTSGLAPNSSIIFKPQYDAKYLSIYLNGSGSFEVSKYDTVEARLDKLNKYNPYQAGYIYKKFNIPKTKELTSETFTNTAYLKLPTSYSEYGVKTKLCIITHGSSMGISDDGSTGWTYSVSYNNIVNALINNGYAVIDSNGYNDSLASGREHWGCPQALSGYYKAYEYFTENYNLEKNVYLYGFSMGGLTALNLMVNRSFPIKCGMIGSPVISLVEHCVGDGSSPNPDFLLAYGMNDIYDANKCRGYDRYLDIVEINTAKHIFKHLQPIYCAYGLSDTAVSNQKILDYFNALHNSNYDATIKGYTGGHEISYGGSQDVINDMIKFFNYY